MSLKHIPLTDFRLPDYPDAPLTVDGAPVSIVDTESLASEATNKNITIPPAIGIATLLYNWHPNALAAFLDLDAWFSFTWTVSIEPDTPSGFKIEIGRIGNQITFGQLDASGENWAIMLTYNVVLDDPTETAEPPTESDQKPEEKANDTAEETVEQDGTDEKQKPKKGTWIPNPKESMLGSRDITSAALIPRLASTLLSRLLTAHRWETGKRVKHNLSIEYAPMDIWGDGIPMSPHWLYKPLDLSTCTTCGATATQDTALQRCGKCGTATYCSDACQKLDWKVHKGVCTMGLEDRGQAIRLVEKGGLIAWDEGKMFAEEGAGEVSRNPYFEGRVGKRVRSVLRNSEE